MPRSYGTVFLDLDGTLLDTAPDLAFALNAVRAEEDLPPLPLAAIRPYVSNGARGLIAIGFPGVETDSRFEHRRQRLLAVYGANLCRETRLFQGMGAVLDEIERRGGQCGVVTNKPGWLTEPLLARLDLQRRMACVVSGDTVARRKPYPDPLLHAAELTGSPPKECVYVGDTARDAQAARAAGMGMLAAAFGYIEPHDDPHSWGADAVIEHPREILAWII